MARDFIRFPKVWDAFVVPQSAAADGGALLIESSLASVVAASSAPPAPPPLTDALSWLPLTFSAIALRIDTLDASLLYDPPSGSTGRDFITGYK